MNIKTGYEPKCIACVDYYLGECHCQKSVYCGMDIDKIPWGRMPVFLVATKMG